jgi:hypothetical protein
MQSSRLRRREFITLLGGVAAWPFVARAQQSKGMRRIGVLMSMAADDPVNYGGANSSHCSVALQRGRSRRAR